MKARPQSFESRLIRDQTTVIDYLALTHQTPRLERTSPETPRQIILRLPISLFEIKGMNGREVKFTIFFLEMLSEWQGVEGVKGTMKRSNASSQCEVNYHLAVFFCNPAERG